MHEKNKYLETIRNTKIYMLLQFYDILMEMDTERDIKKSRKKIHKNKKILKKLIKKIKKKNS